MPSQLWKAATHADLLSSSILYHDGNIRFDPPTAIAGPIGSVDAVIALSKDPAAAVLAGDGFKAPVARLASYTDTGELQSDGSLRAAQFRRLVWLILYRDILWQGFPPETAVTQTSDVAGIVDAYTGEFISITAFGEQRAPADV